MPTVKSAIEDKPVQSIKVQHGGVHKALAEKSYQAPKKSSKQIKKALPK